MSNTPCEGASVATGQDVVAVFTIGKNPNQDDVGAARNVSWTSDSPGIDKEIYCGELLEIVEGDEARHGDSLEHLLQGKVPQERGDRLTDSDVRGRFN